MNSNHIATGGVILMVIAGLGGIYWNKTYVEPVPVIMAFGDVNKELIFEKALKDHDVSFEYVTPENAQRIVDLYRRKDTKISFRLEGITEPGNRVYFIRRSNSEDYTQARIQYSTDVAQIGREKGRTAPSLIN